MPAGKEAFEEEIEEEIERGIEYDKLKHHPYVINGVLLGLGLVVLFLPFSWLIKGVLWLLLLVLYIILKMK